MVTSALPSGVEKWNTQRAPMSYTSCTLDVWRLIAVVSGIQPSDGDDATATSMSYGLEFTMRTCGTKRPPRSSGVAINNSATAPAMAATHHHSNGSARRRRGASARVVAVGLMTYLLCVLTSQRAARRTARLDHARSAGGARSEIAERTDAMAPCHARRRATDWSNASVRRTLVTASANVRGSRAGRRAALPSFDGRKTASS